MMPFTFAVVTAVAQSPSPSPTPKALPGPPPPPEWFALSIEEFHARPEAQAQIDLHKVDHAVLSAAVFHETNARRLKHELPTLQYDGQVWQAAALQANAMAEKQFMGHRQPGAEQKTTPWERVQFVGLRPQFAAENVATEFGLNYKSEKPFYTRTEDGREIYSYAPDGSSIEPHTYLSFAASLLDAWMNSPGHRVNILAREAQFLGCASRQGKDSKGMPVFYCAQVFFTPLTSIPPGGSDESAGAQADVRADPKPSVRTTTVVNAGVFARQRKLQRGS